MVFFLVPRTQTQKKHLPYSSPHPFLKKKTKRKSLQFQHAGYPTHHQPTEKIHGQVNLPLTYLPPPTYPPPQNERRCFKKQAVPALFFRVSQQWVFYISRPWRHTTCPWIRDHRGDGFGELRPGCLGCLIYWFPALLGTSKPAEGDPGVVLWGFTGGCADQDGGKCIGVEPLGFVSLL